MLKRNRELAMVTMLTMLLAVSGVSVGKRMYKYVDENGIIHYTDREPDTDQEVDSWLVEAEANPLISLTKKREENETRIFATNHWHGPIEIGMDFEKASNIRSRPMLPDSVVVDGPGMSPILTISPQAPRERWEYQLTYVAVPGNPSARPSNEPFALPFRRGERFYVGQAFGGLASHTNSQAYHAVDITMPEGTPILAARGGVVMNAEEDFYGSGLDIEKYAGRANNVRVLHDDGTMAVYAHLQLESVAVRAGRKVRTGELLGLSGSTGYSTGPHLHFAVQVNAGLELKTVPFRFLVDGEAIEPRPGIWLSANAP